MNVFYDKEKAQEALEKIIAALKAAQEALETVAENIAERYKEFIEEYKYIYDREPLPQPQKYILMKCFVIDRRKEINRIKKKKGTVYPCFFVTLLFF